MVHNDGALLVINLGIEAGVANEVDNPLLGIVVVESEAGAKVLERDTGVDLAVALEDEVAGRVDKVVGVGEQEEVAPKDLLGEHELVLGLFEIKVDAEGVDEAGDGVLVLVGLLLDDANNVLHLLLLDTGVLRPAAVGDDGNGEVAEDPGGVGLDGVDEAGVEEEVEEGLTGLVVVEEREEGPVDELGAVLELGKRVVGEPGVDALAHLLELLHGGLPAHAEDLAGKTTPCGVRDLVVIGGQDAEAVEELGGIGVVTAGVLELTEVVEGVDHVEGDLSSSLHQLAFIISGDITVGNLTSCSFFKNSKLATLSERRLLTTSSRWRSSVILAVSCSYFSSWWKTFWRRSAYSAGGSLRPSSSQ